MFHASCDVCLLELALLSGWRLGLDCLRSGVLGACIDHRIPVVLRTVAVVRDKAFGRGCSNGGW